MFQLLLLLFFLFPDICFAADPSINSLSGTVADGSTLTINGANFGTHALNLTTLNSNIEGGTVGNVFSKPGNWTSSDDTSDMYAPRYNSTYYHSGTKSLKMYMRQNESENKYDSFVLYNVGSNIVEEGLVSFWVRYNPILTDAVAQWKIWRVHDGASSAEGVYTGSIVGYSHFALSYWMNWDNECQHLNTSRHGWRTNALNYFFGSDVDLHLCQDIWYHVKVYFRRSSAPNVADAMHDGWFSDGTTIQPVTGTGLKSHESEWLAFRMFNFGYYFGDSDPKEAEIYYDDIYVQWGTRAHVEVCEASTYAASKHCETQIPSSWATDSVAVTEVQGSFVSLEGKYVYITNSSGDVNDNGYSITNNPNAAQAETRSGSYSATGASGSYSTTGATISAP